MFRRLRWQLAARYAGVFGLVLAVFVAGALGVVRWALLAGVDAEAHLVAVRWADAVEVRGKAIAAPEAEPGDRPHLDASVAEVQVLDRSGRPVLAEGHVPGLTPVAFDGDRTVVAPPGGPWRVHTEPLRAGGVRVGTVRVVRDLRATDAVFARIALFFLAAVPALAGFTLLAGAMLAARAVQPAEAAFERLRRFTADASHELRTPLATLRAQVESLQVEEGDARLAPLVRATERMTRGLDDLLFLARSDAQAPELGFRPLDLDELVEAAVEDFLPAARARGLALRYRGTPEPLLGDPERLHRAVANVLDNAIKYTGTGEVEVRVGPGPRPSEMLLEVRDTGPGIPEADLPHVFERFYRGNVGTTPGTGLGLAIVRAIVVAHGGRVEAARRPEGGTALRILLPRSRGGRPSC